MIETKGQIDAKRSLVSLQFKESAKGRVTCECSREIPLRMAYRCYYCGAFYCEACAGEHFGKTRAQYNAEKLAGPQ